MANICLLVLIAVQMHCLFHSGQSIPAVVDNGVPSQRNLHQAPSVLTPVKRLAIESALTEAEKLAFLAKHNELRGQTDPPAANMEYMVWDDSLATHAQRWSDECIWAHGVPEENITPFDRVGQNLWCVGPVSENYQISPGGIIQSFFNERRYYDYDTHTCEDGKMCGHYTQVVWATSYAVGCGVTFCPTVTGLTTGNVVVVSCHYGEAGNYYGAKPYVSGTPCTKCSSGIGHCYENQCRSCSDHNETCVCAQVCKNCGTLDEVACKCNCRDGYTLADCGARCIDHPWKCGNVFRYDKCHTSTVKLNCPSYCDLCYHYFPSDRCETDTQDD